MPTVANIQRIDGIGATIKSVRLWFWPNAQNTAAEVPMAQSHYVEYEGFTANNAGGVSVGRGSIDTGDLNAVDYFHATIVQELLQDAFG